MSDPLVTQTVAGRGNFVTGTGDINVNYLLNPVESRERNELLLLVRKVREFWVRGILEKSLHEFALIELGKEARPDAVENPWDTVLSRAGGAKEEIQSGQTLSELFASVTYTLLILGDAGSGKTTTLLQLTRELLNRAESDPQAPVPVVFNLSTWSAKSLPIFDWVIEELRTKYYVPARLGHEWLKTNRLLLLLDGLDEVRASARPACVDAINEFMSAHGVSGLVVCSRIREYLELKKRLRLGGAVFLRPLSTEQVDDYLSKAGESLRPLRQALVIDENLRNLARSPLMLSIMSLAYSGNSTLVTMPSGEAEIKRDQVFAAYVGQMFRRRAKPLCGFTQAAVLYYLHQLAERLERRAVTVFMLDEIQPDWLRRFRFAHLFYWWSTRSLGCVVLAAAVGIPLFANLPGSIPFVLGAGMFAGVVEAVADIGFNATTIRAVRRSVISVALRILACLLLYCGGSGLFFMVLDKKWSPDFQMFATSLTGILAVTVWSGIYTFRSVRSTSGNDIFPAERIVWLWHSSWRGMPWGILWTTLIGLVVVMFYAFLSSVIAAVDGSRVGFWQAEAEGFGELWSAKGALILSVVLVAGAAIGLAIGGLTAVSRTDKARPNQGIRISFFNGLRCIATAGIVLAALVWFMTGVMIGTLENSSLGSALMSAWKVAIPIFLLVGFCYGWLDVVHHWVLRLLLAWRQVMPLRAIQFLDYSCDLIFLQRVGGGYIFIHRLVLEYFASLQNFSASPTIEEQSSTHYQASSA